jgi:hypothetical protein
MTDGSGSDSPQPVQWAWTSTPVEKLGPGGGSGGSPNEPRGGRRTRLALIVGGTLALTALLGWVIAATLPNNGPHTAALAGSDQSATLLQTSSQPVGTPSSSPASASATLSQSPSAAKTTASPSPTHTTQPPPPQAPPAQATHPATTATTASKAAAPSAPPNPAPSATVNVEIADSDDGLVLDVDNSGTSAGTLVGTWSADNSAAQHWHLVLQPNGSYVIYTELMDMKQALEINTNANDYGGNTITTLQPYAGGASMQWTAKYLGSGKYELVSKYNGKCLQGAGQGVANATATCTAGDAHQAWTFVTG